MRKKIDLRKNACLLGAVIMLGACGQAESPDQTTAVAGTEAQTAETATEGKETEGKAALEKESEKESGKDAADEKDAGDPGDKKEAADEEGTGDAGDESEAEGAGDSADKGTEDDKDGEDGKEDGTVTDAAAAAPEGQQAGTDAQEELGADAAAGPLAPDAQQGGKSIAGIYEEITQQVALDSPMVIPDDLIANYYGIDVSTLEEYVFSMSEAATSAETVVILKAKDGGSTGGLSAALQTVIDQKRSEMENYLPDQFQIVDKSLVQVEGDYVYLVISEQADAIRQIIQAGIR